MISKARIWMGIGKPKNPHSIENLKYLYGILNKNQTVTENNKDLLIETLRSISEILIWGDQNDSGVFDFFLEKQMITFFLHYMKQKYGRFICVQLLQTLNILFENIRNETSLYFLLSNNHINNIILNKFDFSDEEVMAYYISFLKTLSLKLNSHSIHFFFNERVAEFPLYVEALKFFDHPEAMVRIAVRTLTLNVFRVSVQPMQRFIKEKTADCYFSNLVWLIRNHILDLDICVKNTTDHTKKSSLIDLIDEYIDHLNYLQDIYTIGNQAISNFLSQQLIRRLFVPIFLNSLLRKDKFSVKDAKPSIQPFLGVYLLSHVFSIITYQPLISDLCEFVFLIDDEKVIEIMCEKSKNPPGQSFDDYLSEPKNLVNYLSSLSRENKRISSQSRRSLSVPHFTNINKSNESISSIDTQKKENLIDKKEKNNENDELITLNVTDDEKYRNLSVLPKSQFGIIFDNLIQYLNTDEYDEFNSLICLSFMYTLVNNPGLPSKVADSIKTRINNGEISPMYSDILMDCSIKILEKSVEPDYKVRLATLELATRVINSIACEASKSSISEIHMARINQVSEQSALMLKESFRSEEMFLDIFEHEYHNFNTHTFNCDTLLREWSILLTPTSTPLSGIELSKRFPCGDTEKLKHLMRTFFLIRSLCLYLTNQIENQLPLTKQEHLVKENDALDLNSSDLIACTVNLKEKKDRRFLVIDPIQFILVEPEVKRIGWGIVKFSDLIQDVEVSPDKEDSRSLNITIKKSTQSGKSNILLNSTFTFDDHIRCMAAKQHLVRARDRARRMKLEKISQLLNLSLDQTAQKPIFMHSHSQNDILPYNIVAGYNLLNNHHHPGRASMISSTWSQITQSEKNTQLMSSPMAAFSKTSSPLNNKSNSLDPNSISVSFYKNQISFTSPSLARSANSNASLDMNKFKDKVELMPIFSSKNTSDSGVQLNQNESDDFLVTKLKESIKPFSNTDVNVNNESSADASAFPDDPSIQYY